MSSLKIKSEIKRKIEEQKDYYIDFLENHSVSDFPVTDVKLENNKTLIFKRSVYNTRGFSSKFRLYVNKEFNRDSPDGVYTWLLLYIPSSDKVIFLTTQAYNDLEIHAKHGFIIPKYFKEKGLKIPSKVSVIVAGELEKINDDIQFNFSSGTFMAGRTDITEENPNIDIVKYIFFEILNFDKIFYLDNPIVSIIKKTTDPIGFIRSIPGGVKHHIVDSEIANKIKSELPEIRLKSQINQEYRKKELMDKYGRPFDDTNLNELESQLEDIKTLKRKYPFDGKNKYSLKKI
jgi:hypothetical protein